MKLIECPRDAWQGYEPFIPTDQKAAYINKLLEVGFDTIDFGSFVSAKAIPQVRDTAQLIDLLDLSGSATKLLSIVANERGAMDACRHEKITYLGYPFSVSETFQLRNTNTDLTGSLERVLHMAEICQKHQKEMVLYISMGFGNPYGDPYSSEIVYAMIDNLAQYGIRIFSLADTVGLASEMAISTLFNTLISSRPDLEFGAHFHTRPEAWLTKIETAYRAGCRRFDGALLGYGGCPMAQDDLVGNTPTENLIAFATARKELLNLNVSALDEARRMFLKMTGH